MKLIENIIHCLYTKAFLSVWLRFHHLLSKNKNIENKTILIVPHSQKYKIVSVDNNDL